MSACRPNDWYLETKWASLISFELAVDLLKDTLPIAETVNAAGVRNHLHRDGFAAPRGFVGHDENRLGTPHRRVAKGNRHGCQEGVAERAEAALGDERVSFIEGCPGQWAALPCPEPPLTVGIDGCYVRQWEDKKAHFEVIVGKSLSEDRPSRCFGFVQTYDEKPKRRLFELLKGQGMQMNQPVMFFSDGGTDIREVQQYLNPEAEHYLDWFHITRARDRIEDIHCFLDNEEVTGENSPKLRKALDEFDTYVAVNEALIPNYGERWRNEESIATGFVESAVNQIVSKRFAKKQQMQWTKKSAHLVLQMRTQVLDERLEDTFRDWYPDFRTKLPDNEIQQAA